MRWEYGRYIEATPMISELKIRNFKSLESVDLKLGNFNLLVGANASGKSNFLDALRFLQGVGSGLSIDEILNGKPTYATSRKWDGIRGGSKLVGFRTKDGKAAQETTFKASFLKDAGLPYSGDTLSYEVSFFPTEGTIRAEILGTPRADISNDKRMHVRTEPATTYQMVGPGSRTVSASKPFANVPEEDRSEWAQAHTRNVIDQLFNMQNLNPDPTVLRQYSRMIAGRLGEKGEDFPAVVHSIERTGNKGALLDWLKEMRPEEVEDIHLAPGADNDLLFYLKESDNLFPATVLSDGTLRFIALAAAFFQPSMPKVLVIEDIEKGLHPSRLRLLLELMRSQSKRTGTQVFATTHSPTLLAWLTEEDRKTTFVCTRDAESGATKMRSLAEVPRLEELVKEHYNLDELFEQGWIESVLHES
jgi:predicted ATPase